MTEIMPTTPEKPAMIVRTVQVTITKEIRVEFPESWGSPENIADWCKGLWDIKGVDDIAKYAAEMAAQFGAGYSHDGIGLLAQSYSTYPRVPDCKFDENYSDVESEIIEENPKYAEKKAVQS